MLHIQTMRSLKIIPQKRKKKQTLILNSPEDSTLKPQISDQYIAY